MAKNDSAGVVKANGSEVRDCPDEQAERAAREALEGIMNKGAEGLPRAKPHERSSERRGHRNGSRKRGPKTGVGEIGLSIPLMRAPALRATAIERYPRMEISREEALIAMRFLGLSTGKKTDVAEMLRDLPLSSSTQSRPNEKAHRRLGKWGMGPTSPAIPYPRP